MISFIKKKPFPKKLLIATLSGVVLQNGPGPVTSPTENYTANAFYEPYGGASGGVNVTL